MGNNLNLDTKITISLKHLIIFVCSLLSVIWTYHEKMVKPEFDEMKRLNERHYIEFLNTRSSIGIIEGKIDAIGRNMTTNQNNFNSGTTE